MRLFLVLALLGAVDGGPLSQRAPELERPAEQGRGSAPPWQGEGWGFGARGAQSHRYRYIVVKEAQTFEKAKNTCTQRYHGCLASIHNNQMNRQLCEMCKQDQVWVGGIISSLGGRPSKKWVDGSSWNYHKWADWNPSRNGKTCVALCTAGGHWKSISCETRLPFICEIPSRCS